MKFRASDVKVMFIIITCIRTIIYIYREDFAQQYRKCGARSGSPQLYILAASIQTRSQNTLENTISIVYAMAGMHTLCVLFGPQGCTQIIITMHIIIYIHLWGMSIQRLCCVIAFLNCALCMHENSA